VPTPSARQRPARRHGHPGQVHRGCVEDRKPEAARRSANHGVVCGSCWTTGSAPARNCATSSLPPSLASPAMKRRVLRQPWLLVGFSGTAGLGGWKPPAGVTVNHLNHRRNPEPGASDPPDSGRPPPALVERRIAPARKQRTPTARREGRRSSAGQIATRFRPASTATMEHTGPASGRGGVSHLRAPRPSRRARRCRCVRWRPRRRPTSHSRSSRSRAGLARAHGSA
jgi:hypothetical protein